MKKLPFKLPAVGFFRGPGSELEELAVFTTRRDFDPSIQWTPKPDHLTGMAVFDRDGVSWRIEQATYTLLNEKALRRMFFPDERPEYAVELVVEERGAFALDELKARVQAMVAADPTEWVNEELAVGESGPPVGEGAQIAALQQRIEHAPDFIALLKALEVY